MIVIVLSDMLCFLQNMLNISVESCLVGILANPTRGLTNPRIIFMLIASLPLSQQKRANPVSGWLFDAMLS